MTFNLRIRVIAIWSASILILTSIDYFFQTTTSIAVTLLLLLNLAFYVIYRLTRRAVLYLTVHVLSKVVTALLLLFALIVNSRLPSYRSLYENLIISLVITLGLMYFLKSYIISKYGLMFAYPVAIILLELLVLAAPLVWVNVYHKISRTKQV